MKKTINITLNGLVFSLEEDGYEKLKNYLDSIKNYYDSPDEEKEIMADIESSIAEKFSEKLKSKNQAITIADVEDAIKIMGTINEIAESSTIQDTAEEIKDKTKLKRRLYRDSDDVIIAGVASGIAAYFGIDPVFFRVGFVLLSFANGLGILAYLILWVAIPKAETNAQKLEMRGKPVNLAELQKTIKEKSKVISEGGREAVSRLKSEDAFYRIMNFPIKIINLIFIFLKKAVGFFLPIVRILAGALAVIGSIVGILGFGLVSALMIFNINSPYIVSDYPLAELASLPMYYIGVISLFAVCALPMIFLSALGVTIIRKKNSFNLVGSSILIGVWMVAVVTSVVAAADLAPAISARVQEINRQPTVVRNYDFKDFNKLYIGAEQNIKIKKGDNYSVQLTGKEASLDRLAFNIEDGQLQITQSQRTNKGVCLFCFGDEITGEIIMPRLDSFVGIGSSRAEIKDFTDDVYVSLGESARADMELDGQNLKSSLSGIDSRLKLFGKAQAVDIAMDGSAELFLKEFTAEKIILDMSIFSSADLFGETKQLIATLKNHSELNSVSMEIDDINIRAENFAEAKIWAKDKLNAISFNEAEIFYKGEPMNFEKTAADNSFIKRWELNNNNE